MQKTEESQANLPPSEQQVYEPKKYTGSAIPSRSFKMLQAMTAPESIGESDNSKKKNTLFYLINSNFSCLILNFLYK